MYYSQLLETHPVVTKSITSGFMYAGLWDGQLATI
jgi:hypothetical protein